MHTEVPPPPLLSCQWPSVATRQQMGQEPRHSSRLLLGAGLLSSLRVGEGAFPTPPLSSTPHLYLTPAPRKPCGKALGGGCRCARGSLPLALWPGSLELGAGLGCMGSPGLAWGAGVAETTLSP